MVGKINAIKSETYVFDAQTEQYAKSYPRSAMLERCRPVMQASASFLPGGAEANVAAISARRT